MGFGKKQKVNNNSKDMNMGLGRSNIWTDYFLVLLYFLLFFQKMRQLEITASTFFILLLIQLIS